MKFKVDENLPNTVAGILEDAGHNAATVHDEGLQGAPDPQIVEAILEEGRALLTLDVGFGDIRSYPPEDYKGIILLRLERHDMEHVEAIVGRIASSLVEEDVVGKLWVVDESRVRIRG